MEETKVDQFPCSQLLKVEYCTQVLHYKYTWIQEKVDDSMLSKHKWVFMCRRQMNEFDV